MLNKVLLHICCAPCSIACIESLRQEDLSITALWYNPNIHPVTEYRLRRDTLKNYAQQIDLPLILDDTYGLRAFCKAIGDDYFNRCPKCYEMRMDMTARVAKEQGFDAFSTTLLISPYQQHDLLCAAAQQAADRHGVAFLYRDFRPLFQQGQNRAAELDLYRQKYCGCVFSEEERYRAKQLARERAAQQKD